MNVLESDELVAEAASKGIGFTVCPVSNRYVTGDLKDKELKSMLERGLKVTVNSDDPAYFAAYLSANLEALADAASLTQSRPRSAGAKRFRDRLAADRRQGRPALRTCALRGEQPVRNSAVLGRSAPTGAGVADGVTNGFGAGH